MSCSAFLSLRAACTCVCTWGAVDFIKPCSPLSAPCFRCRSRTLPRRLFLCLSRPGLATSGLSSFALTLGTTTPQSPTMSIGLLRLEIMHISRIRQLWLRRRVATLSIPLSCAQRVAKSATTNPTAAALAVHGRACAAREASTRTTMGTKHATGIPPWQKDTSSASTSSCASAQAAML